MLAQIRLAERQWCHPDIVQLTDTMCGVMAWWCDGESQKALTPPWVTVDVDSGRPRVQRVVCLACENWKRTPTYKYFINFHKHTLYRNAQGTRTLSAESARFQNLARAVVVRPQFTTNHVSHVVDERCVERLQDVPPLTTATSKPHAAIVAEENTAKSPPAHRGGAKRATHRDTRRRSIERQRRPTEANEHGAGNEVGHCPLLRQPVCMMVGSNRRQRRGKMDAGRKVVWLARINCSQIKGSGCAPQGAQGAQGAQEAQGAQGAQGADSVMEGVIISQANVLQAVDSVCAPVVRWESQRLDWFRLPCCQLRGDRR
jgi:hypothetical protein